MHEHSPFIHSATLERNLEKTSFFYSIYSFSLLCRVTTISNGYCAASERKFSNISQKQQTRNFLSMEPFKNTLSNAWTDLKTSQIKTTSPCVFPIPPRCLIKIFLFVSSRGTTTNYVGSRRSMAGCICCTFRLTTSGGRILYYTTSK